MNDIYDFLTPNPRVWLEAEAGQAKEYKKETTTLRLLFKLMMMTGIFKVGKLKCTWSNRLMTHAEQDTKTQRPFTFLIFKKIMSIVSTLFIRKEVWENLLSELHFWIFHFIFRVLQHLASQQIAKDYFNKAFNKRSFFFWCWVS